MSAEQIEVLALASYEALANAATRAYSDGAGVLEVHATYLPERTHAQVTVTDSGTDGWLRELTSIASLLALPA